MLSIVLLGAPEWKSVTLLGCDEDAAYVAKHIAFQRRVTTPPRVPPIVPSIGLSRVRTAATGLVSPDSVRTASPRQSSFMLPLSPKRIRTDDGRARASIERGAAQLARESAPAVKAEVGRQIHGQLYAEQAAQQPFDSVADLLSRKVASAAACIHGVAEDGRTPLTGARLLELVEATSLTPFGLGLGDRVCSAIGNGPEAATLFLCLANHCTFAPLNRMLTRTEMAFEFEDLPAKASPLASAPRSTNVPSA